MSLASPTAGIAITLSNTGPRLATPGLFYSRALLGGTWYFDRGAAGGAPLGFWGRGSFLFPLREGGVSINPVIDVVTHYPRPRSTEHRIEREGQKKDHLLVVDPQWSFVLFCAGPRSTSIYTDWTFSFGLVVEIFPNQLLANPQLTRRLKKPRHRKKNIGRLIRWGGRLVTHPLAGKVGTNPSYRIYPFAWDKGPPQERNETWLQHTNIP